MACASNNRTSSITWETRASCNGAAVVNRIAATKNKRTPQTTIVSLPKVFGKDLFIFIVTVMRRSLLELGLVLDAASPVRQLFDPLRWSALGR